MRDAIVHLLRQSPFRPFSVQMTNGEKREIANPELVAMLQSCLLIGKSGSNEYEICSLEHVANISANGADPKAAG